ncbi:integral membrane protein S linking to the trans Golgi network-domain-containing protein [Elsinoe ampelina]|uniref:Integral membrane protein S linking to the trans Golgi network-domain-containing protein n=1 Tax=Elsinoe ampelina TaxID=302913 RepID=A0A6A6G162_9PEZI|nr:integral membrane protein S linking to the trans Golgi network-domain-containing protein [Elsinoe ampelina]
MPRRRRPTRPGALADLAPKRILTQIVVLQALYYLCAAALIIFTTLVAGKPVSLDLLFDWETVRGDVTTGWTLALCWMFDALICVIFLLLLIARSKLVPDFALTIHFLHLIVVSFYTKRIPTQLFWWGLQGASAALMTFLGMWACQWRELKPIAFGGRPKANGAAVAGASSGEQSQGLLPGTAGQSAESAGAYEMMGIRPKDEAV